MPSTTSSRSTDRSRWIVMGVATLVVVAGLVAALTAGGGDTASAIETLPAPEVTGDALPPFRATAADQAAGTAAPAFTASTLAGQRVEVDPSNQGPMAVVFLAHWCPHCQREVPAVQEWLDQGGLPDGVELRAVTTSIDDGRPNHPPDAWLEREGWTPTTYVDGSNAIADAYGLGGFPYWVFIDAEGDVVGRIAGELPIDQLEQVTRQLAER